MTLDNCKGCGERVKDFDPDGFEGADAQRGHFACGQVPVTEVTMSTYQAEHADGERCREAELNRDCPRHHIWQPVAG